MIALDILESTLTLGLVLIERFKTTLLVVAMVTNALKEAGIHEFQWHLDLIPGNQT